jgi:hypothetical protein
MKPLRLIALILLCSPALVQAAAQNVGAAVVKDLAGHDLKNIESYNFVATESVGGMNVISRVT